MHHARRTSLEYLQRVCAQFRASARLPAILWLGGTLFGRKGTRTIGTGTAELTWEPIGPYLQPYGSLQPQLLLLHETGEE